MCNVWQQKLVKQISVDEARALFSNPLFRKVAAVGLNGGEPTLRRDLAEIGDMLFCTLPNLKAVSLITNGLHADRAIERIDELGRAVGAHNGRLDVMVSLDGVGDTHDRVRGVPGNFENASRVLDHVLAQPHRMTARVGCTVIADNVFHVHELLDYCRAKRVYVKFRLGIPNRRLYNLPTPPPMTIGKRTWIDTHPFDLNAEQRWHFGQFLYGLIDDYEPALQQRQFYASLAAQILEGKPRRAGCDWQHRGVTVSSRGEILYCAVQSDVLGNGLEENPTDLYFGNQQHLKKILAEKCASCAHDYVGPPGGREQVALAIDGLLRSRNLTIADVRQSWLYETLATAKKFTVAPIAFAKRRRELGSVAAAAPSPSIKNGVLICGWYGTETLGDKAILAAIVAAIRDVKPDEDIEIASLNEACTRLTVAQMPDLDSCRIIGIRAALANAKQYRIVVFGGGPLMAINEMAEMEALFRSAAANGSTTIIAGCGVGPLGASCFQNSIRGLLASATQRIFRDDESLGTAIKLLGTKDSADIVCEDPAVSWVAAHRAAAPSATTQPTLALGLRDWPFTQYAPELTRQRAREIKARFEDGVVLALEQLVAEMPTLRILPIPFCTHRIGGDDRVLYWRILNRSSKLRTAFDVSLISRELTPIEYLAQLDSAHAALAMRFHSLVFATTLGIPTFAIDYTLGSGKTHALAQRTGCPMLRIDQVDADSLCSGLRKALSTSRVKTETSLRFVDSFKQALMLGGLGHEQDPAPVPHPIA